MMTLERAQWLYESTCVGKRRFLSLALARKSAHQRRHRKGVKRLAAYACPFCGMAHRGRIPETGRTDLFQEHLREAAAILAEHRRAA
jgi:hypothetical protein